MPVRPPGLRGNKPNGFSSDPAQRASDATIVNNIFRNYGHQHVYDFDEFLRAAELECMRAPLYAHPHAHPPPIAHTPHTPRTGAFMVPVADATDWRR